MMQLSAALFAVAGTVWLISGNLVGVGVTFIAVALALFVAGRLVLTKV
jgi:hypothetical protein